MSTLLIGDPHLKPTSIETCKTFLNWIEQVAQEHKVDRIINLGDTWHTHNVIRSEVLSLVTQHICNVESLGVEHIVLVGNHDMAHHTNGAVHAWVSFKKRYKNLHIIDCPEQIDNIAFMPYMDDPASFQRYLDAAESSKMMFCHQTFIGANYGFVTSKDGVTLPTGSMPIISGHVHKKQRLGPVWYPGTPYAQESSDHNEEKGVHIITDNNKIIFIKSVLPMWRTYNCTTESWQETIESINPNDRNHIVMTGPTPELNSIMDGKQFQELKKALKFSVKRDSTSGVKINKTIQAVSSLESSIVSYIEDIYTGNADRDKLKIKCLSVLQ